MGKIRKILETELVGGTQSTDVYPVTSTKAVYDTDNKVLDNYIQHLKKTSTFAGIATPTTNPGTPDGPVFYIAGEGTYVNFSNLVIGVGQLGILKWDGTWSKQVLEIGAGGGSGSISGGGSNSGTTGILYFGAPNKNLGFNGSKDMSLAFGDGLKVEKNDSQITVSAIGGGTGSGVTLSPTMNAINNQLGKTTLNTPQFLYWDGSTYTWKNESEISGGSGSSSRIKKIKLFNTRSDYPFETIELGTADTIGFMAGNNVSLEYVIKDFTNVIKISATGGSGGSSGSTSTSVSWEDVTNKPSTFTPSSHTHTTRDINDLSNYVQGVKVSNATNADKATQLKNPRLIWGQSFDGTGNINGNLKMGSAGGGSIQLWMNNDNILERTNNTLHIGYGLKQSSNGEINLDAYATKVYTDNMSKHYDFKSNVFDVNSNQIHFGSETNGGKIYWDAANNAFKIEGNVYATGGITALGVSNNATTSNNVDFTFRSVTSPTYKFNNGSYLTETSTDINIATLKLYHADSNQYILLNNAYENISGDPFLGHIIDSNCMSFMNADWYYFDNSIVTPEITANRFIFCNADGNQGATLSDIAISKVSSQTRLIFTINGVQYYVNAN